MASLVGGPDHDTGLSGVHVLCLWSGLWPQGAEDRLSVGSRASFLGPLDAVWVPTALPTRHLQGRGMECPSRVVGTRWPWLVPWLIVYQLCAIDLVTALSYKGGKQRPSSGLDPLSSPAGAMTGRRPRRPLAEGGPVPFILGGVHSMSQGLSGRPWGRGAREWGN